MCWCFVVCHINQQYCHHSCECVRVHVYLFVWEGKTDSPGFPLWYSRMISLISKNIEIMKKRYSHLSLHNATIKFSFLKHHVIYICFSIQVQLLFNLSAHDDFLLQIFSSLVHLVLLLIGDYLHTSKLTSKVRPHKHIFFLDSLLPSNSFQEKISHKAGSPSSHLDLHCTG